MIHHAMSDKAILIEIGQRLRRRRLNMNITQVNLGNESGVARSVIQSLESGRGIKLLSLIRILRVLDLDNLDSFLPDPGFSPIQVAKLLGKKRQRASKNLLHL